MAPTNARRESPDASKAARIITAFGQGDVAGNCASVSVIKLALFTYGYEGTFATVGSASAPYVLHDGKTVMVSDEEVRQVGALADFHVPGPDRDVAEQATRMLTVMARNKCVTQGSCRTIVDAFDRGSRFLDESTANNFTWLGLQKERMETPPPGDAPAFESRGAYIVTSQIHSAFGFGGYYDEHGRAVPIGSFEEKHSSWWTRLWGLRHINDMFTLSSAGPVAWLRVDGVGRGR